METLWNESLWGDEGFSALAVQRPFLETIGVVMRDTAPPLFYVVGWGWGRIFGFSEASLRSLSLLLVLGAAYFAFKIVDDLGRKRWVALVSGGLAFFSPFLFPFAFEWRMYALFAFTVMGSVYFFCRRRWWGYIAFTTAALYTHHYALFSVAAQGLWFLFTDFTWKSRKAIYRQLWPFILVGIFYLPWLYPFYLQLTRLRGAGFWISTPSLSEVINLVYRFVTGGVVEKWRGLAAILVGVLLVGKRWELVARKWLELAFVFFIPVVAAYAVSLLVTPIFYDRYLLSVVVGMAVLVGMGTRRWGLPVLVGLFLLYAVGSVTLFTHPTKRPFRALASYVKSEKREGDFLLNYNGRAHHLWESIYYGIPAPIYTPEGPLPLYVGTAQMTESDTFSELPTDVGRLGVITSDSVEDVAIPQPWRLSESREFGELKVLWFDRE